MDSVSSTHSGSIAHLGNAEFANLGLGKGMDFSP